MRARAVSRLGGEPDRVGARKTQSVGALDDRPRDRMLGESFDAGCRAE
jgi:hypothetical protein